MMFVRAKAAGVWRTVPQTPPRAWEKTMIRVGDIEGQQTWAVNHRPVKVFPGLILSFLEKEDTSFFLQQGKADLPIVETGMELCFEDDADARYFASQGLAELLTGPMTHKEVMALFADLQKRAEAEAAEVYFEGAGGGGGGGGGNHGDKIIEVRGKRGRRKRQVA